MAAASILESVNRRDMNGASMAIQEAADKIAASENVQHATSRAVEYARRDSRERRDHEKVLNDRQASLL